jgi:hypothetical protein
MDISAGLRDKLRFIERHYAAASAPFRETKRKIEDHEEPFEPPSFDPENDNCDEPPFLAEWQEASESLNIEGQAALKLVQGALRDYLSSFVDLYGVPLTAKGKNWFEKYKKHFLDVYGIDFEKAPVPLDELEEVNLARNDTEHSGLPFGMTRRQSKEHALRFPEGLFVDEMEKQVFKSSGHVWQGTIQVTEAGLAEAIRRVETFCEFLDAQRFSPEFFTQMHSAGGRT